MAPASASCTLLSPAFTEMSWPASSRLEPVPPPRIKASALLLLVLTATEPSTAKPLCPLPLPLLPSAVLETVLIVLSALPPPEAEGMMSPGPLAALPSWLLMALVAVPLPLSTAVVAFAAGPLTLEPATARPVCRPSLEATTFTSPLAVILVACTEDWPGMAPMSAVVLRVCVFTVAETPMPLPELSFIEPASDRIQALSSAPTNSEAAPTSNSLAYSLVGVAPKKAPSFMVPTGSTAPPTVSLGCSVLVMGLLPTFTKAPSSIAPVVVSFSVVTISVPFTAMPLAGAEPPVPPEPAKLMSTVCWAAPIARLSPYRLAPRRTTASVSLLSR